MVFERQILKKILELVEDEETEEWRVKKKDLVKLFQR